MGFKARPPCYTLSASNLGDLGLAVNSRIAFDEFSTTAIARPQMMQHHHDGIVSFQFPPPAAWVLLIHPCQTSAVN